MIGLHHLLGYCCPIKITLHPLPAASTHGVQRLGRLLEDEHDLPAEEMDVRPSGRPDRAQADALFPAYREAVESDPENWRVWFRLGLAYDGAGDRSRARAAIRTAIRLEKAQPRP